MFEYFFVFPFRSKPRLQVATQSVLSHARDTFDVIIQGFSFFHIVEWKREDRTCTDTVSTCCTCTSHKIYFVERQKNERNKIQYDTISIIISNGIIMENTALNGTSTTTVTKNQEWKMKKGYGPIIVAVSLALLLGLSFYAGRHSAEMRMPNGVPSSSSSSSLSLVGSGTAAALSRPPQCTKPEDCPPIQGVWFLCTNGRCDGHMP